MGYVPSNVDPSVFLWKDSIIVCYMDNVLIFSKSDNVIDSMLTVLKEQDYVFIIDDNVDEYLRIQISYNKDGSIQFI